MSSESYSPEDGKLVVDSLTKKFGGLTAVDDFSFTIEEGEILAIIGPNGAGKSTTFNCITGLFKPTDGTVWYDGDEITNEPMYKVVNRGLARTFQSFRPLEDRTVLKNVMLALSPNRIFSLSGLLADTEEEATEICELVGLGDDLDVLPSELPHAGMLRLGVARALASEPDLLLLDEPFAGLSGEEVNELSELFESLRQNGITLAVIDHNMRGLLSLADRVVVLNFGEKLTEGTPEEIRNDPEVQRAYLGGDI
jgi:branched-chain amino acid transport system ATP-binding protein